MTIARILTTKGRDVITTQQDRTLAEVAEVLIANKIGAVVVVDDQGRIIGLLSERDIVRVLAEHGTAVFNDAVSVHMTTQVITIVRMRAAMRSWKKWPMNALATFRSSGMKGSSSWCRSAT
jgi:CBS domain-containing protein